MSDDLVNRVEAAIAPHLGWGCHKAVEEMKKVCESPIEIMFGAAFLMVCRICGADRQIFRFCSPSLEEKLTVPFLVMAQYNWRNYRIDFAVKRTEAPGKFIFVECDGHDFHERTKEQAERDRSKDREIQQAGIAIFRFTGREIYRDVAQCVGQVLDFTARM
jgi:very-short-patch-repair endonuclease